MTQQIDFHIVYAAVCKLTDPILASEILQDSSLKCALNMPRFNSFFLTLVPLKLTAY